MNRVVLVLVAMLAFPLAAGAAEADAKAQLSRSVEPSRWTLWLNTLGGAHSAGGGGGVGSLGVTWKPLWWLQPELAVGVGAQRAAPLDFINRFVFGTRLNFAREGATPYLWLAAPHIHETALAAAQRDPVGAVLSLSRTVHHRQAGELGFGVDVPFRTGVSSFNDGQQWNVSARLSGIGFLDANGPRAWVAAEVGLGLPL
ncbi:MAG: hypothetical protein ACK4N5_23385 [Myxococcales bacterium]